MKTGSSIGLAALWMAVHGCAAPPACADIPPDHSITLLEERTIQADTSELIDAAVDNWLIIQRTLGESKVDLLLHDTQAMYAVRYFIDHDALGTVIRCLDSRDIGVQRTVAEFLFQIDKVHATRNKQEIIAAVLRNVASPRTIGMSGENIAAQEIIRCMLLATAGPLVGLPEIDAEKLLFDVPVGYEETFISKARSMAPSNIQSKKSY